MEGKKTYSTNIGKPVGNNYNDYSYFTRQDQPTYGNETSKKREFAQDEGLDSLDVEGNQISSLAIIIIISLSAILIILLMLIVVIKKRRQLCGKSPKEEKSQVYN